jgi:hypothetical protein
VPEFVPTPKAPLGKRTGQLTAILKIRIDPNWHFGGPGVAQSDFFSDGTAEGEASSFFIRSEILRRGTITAE